MQNRAYNLMKKWCDTLLSHQIHTNIPYTDNALVCPACHTLHGRVADLCFPLVTIWERTKDEHYLLAADKLIDWSEYNLKTQDGLWYNDAQSRWFGTSAFSAMSIGEALLRYGDKLPKKYKDKWFSIFVRMTDAVSHFDELVGFMPPTNYFCGYATNLAMGWLITGNNYYCEKAEYWINRVLPRFDGDGLLFGEGTDKAAKDGSHTIDMGYNLEESIPLLLRYSSITGRYKDLSRKALLDHLEFLLPDGAIDDSFGTRHNKWTYWGSRTSDGLVEGLALVLDEPVFATACERVLSQYEKCTHDGLLAMPMAHEENEPTCIHHTFTHARALCALVCADTPSVSESTQLPSEREYGVKSYQNGRLLLLSKGGFRASVSAIQARYIEDAHADTGGGSLNLLYHRLYGVICAATLARYVPDEPLNQQYLRNSKNPPPCMTAQFELGGKMACHADDAVLIADRDRITANTDCWRAEYSVCDGEFCIDLSCRDGFYNLPVVCSKNSKVEINAEKNVLKIDNSMTVSSSAPLIVDCDKRVFNQVGGLLYLPMKIKVKDNAKIAIKVD